MNNVNYALASFNCQHQSFASPSLIFLSNDKSQFVLLLSICRDALFSFSLESFFVLPFFSYTHEFFVYLSALAIPAKIQKYFLQTCLLDREIKKSIYTFSFPN